VFTGIVEEVGRVASVRPGKVTVSADRVLQGVEFGASISVNGVCLTVTHFDAGSFSVDVMRETLDRSNLGTLSVGDHVNLERALTLSSRMGGHLVQGHIDATGRVFSLQKEGEAVIMRFGAPPGVMRYIVEKGFVAVDGVSLTVTASDEGSFSVSTVGFTRQTTTLSRRRVGDTVNIEVDIIAKYVEQFVQGRQGGVTAELLSRNGFLAGKAG
jgi:riboflavin synthase